MTQIVASEELAKQLAAADGPVRIVDESGAVLAVCTPMRFPRSPYTRAEVEEARQEAREHPEQGMSITEVIQNLRAPGGGQP